MKLYGSMINRLSENTESAKNITVGMGVTEYSYSDRTPYEVVEVKDQKHISIRKLEAVRIDNNGMSDDQHYEFKQNEKNAIVELALRNGVWYQIHTYSKEKWMKLASSKMNVESFGSVENAYNWMRWMSHLTEKQYEAIDAGKEVKHYSKMNIVVGKADSYYDYSF